MGKSSSSSHDPQHPLQNPSTAPTDIVVRNLRRRLWAAVAQEDSATALWLYRATLSDWEECLRHEAQLATDRVDEVGRGGLRKRLATFRKNSKSRVCAAPPVGRHDGSADAAAVETPLLLQHFLPSEPFVEDDFRNAASDPYPDTSPDGKRVVRTDASAARGRFALGALLLGRHATPPAEQSDNNAETKENQEDSGLPLTTPLHEAARLGNGELVRLLLEQVALSDPNARNGNGQTALHCVAGGFSRLEEQHGPPVPPTALRVPHVNLTPLDEDAMQHAKKAVRAVGRLFRGQWAKDEVPKPETQFITLEEWHKLALDRLDATLAIMSWCNTEGDGQGISTNAVDDVGRTALHYAAEAGRDEICQALLSREETFLTLVDQQRHTPCDLADRSGNEKLAAHLEARAILYRDPFGMDDELLAQIIQNSSGEYDEDVMGTKLVSPFAWFTTYDMEQVTSERERRVQEALSLIQKVVDRRSEGEKALKQLLGEPLKTQDPDLDIRNFRRIHGGHIELLLQDHNWDVKNAVIAFTKSPLKTFEACRIGLPPLDLIYSENSDEGFADDSHKNDNATSGDDYGDDDDTTVTCLICCDDFTKSSDEWKVLKSCSHGFCSSCLGDYIADAANTGTSGLAVKCPHHACMSPLDPSEVSQFSGEGKVLDRLVASSNNSFVMGSKALRFCPHPDCRCVVKFTLPSFAKEAGLDNLDIFDLVGAVCARRGTSKQPTVLSYEGVDDPHYFNHEIEPKKAHRFCFSCGEPRAHWPVKCDSMDEWKQEVATHLKEVEGENLDDEDFDGIAQKLWMKVNTKPCPKCEMPIQKDQGCNHMTCVNPACNYEFCWICRKEWSSHSTQTGGYFRCNRWQENPEDHEYYDTPPNPEEIHVPTDEDLSDPSRMRAVYGTAMHESRVAYKKSKEVGRFIHHYHRWSAHSESRKLESSMGESVCKRMEPVIIAAKEYTRDASFNFGGKGLWFLYAAFSELDECRSVLLHSYPYAYYRYGSIDLRRHGYRQYRHLLREKKQFEKLQSELELLTENMSDIVARKHLRANESQIRFMQMTAAEKRKDFNNLILSTLTEEKKEAERMTRVAASVPRTALDRIVGVMQGLSTDDEGFETSNAVAYIEDAFRRSLDQFQVRAESPHLSEIDIDGFDEQEVVVYPAWSCPDCTFMNEERSAPFCEMCGGARPDLEVLQ